VAEHSVDAIKKQNKNLDPKSLDRLDKVKKSLIQSKMLLGRVKSWIQIGNGRINVQNEAINLVPFIKETIDLFEEKARAKEITIRTEWHEDINEIKIWADPIALYNQVLSNTISNAIKFSYRNSDIVIKVHNCSENVYVTIKDKGMGIKDEHLASFHKNGHIESSIGTEN
jgi:signal transduction histidine kinase